MVMLRGEDRKYGTLYWVSTSFFFMYYVNFTVSISLSDQWLALLLSFESPSVLIKCLLLSGST